jgi:hypothetical protein
VKGRNYKSHFFPLSVLLQINIATAKAIIKIKIQNAAILIPPVFYLLLSAEVTPSQ